MFLVPYRRVEVVSELSPLEIHSRLFRLTGKRGEFDGKISTGSFRIYPSEITRNTYLPHVYGEVTPYADGTQITLRFFPNLIASVLLLGFFCFFEYDVKRVEGHLSWIPVGFFLLIHVTLYLFGFLPEQRKIEKRLLDAFEPSKIAKV